MNHGLYVDLDPFDVHVFVLEPQVALQATQKWLGIVAQTLGEWPLNRVARVARTKRRRSHLATAQG
jgi:hypothetical protein